MSWPSSNFHHDSFEYIKPPRPEYRPSSTFINHNTYINFNGPSSSSIRTAGWLNFAGNIFQGLSNLGAAWMMSKGNSTGAQAIQMGGSTIGNLLGGGYGGGYGMGWNTGGSGYLLDQTYYNPVPLIHGSATGTNSGSGTSSGSGAGSGSSASSGSGASSGSSASSGSGANSGSGVSSGSGAGSGSGASSGSGAGSGSGVGSGSGTGSGSGSSGATGNGKITAEDFNKAIDDKLDRNGDGKVDDKDIFSADMYNSKYQLGHTTSKVGDKTGIRHGVATKNANNVDAEEKTNGFYKYITVTDKDTGNEWSYQYVNTDASGNPVYKFSPTYSDLSKDNNGSNKGWETTGQSPQVTITVDKANGQIKMVSNGDLFSASQKGHLGKI